MKAPENIQELVSELSQNYADIKAKRLPLNQAKELHNAAGKIINGCKTQVMYNAFMGIKEPIPFLTCVTDRSGIPDRREGYSGEPDGVIAGTPQPE